MAYTCLLPRVETSAWLHQSDEAQVYERCLKEALEQENAAWADGNIRVGDYILPSKLLFTLIHAFKLKLC